MIQDCAGLSQQKNLEPEEGRGKGPGHARWTVENLYARDLEKETDGDQGEGQSLY